MHTHYIMYHFNNSLTQTYWGLQKALNLLKTKHIKMLKVVVDDSDVLPGVMKHLTQGSSHIVLTSLPGYWMFL